MNASEQTNQSEPPAGAKAPSALWRIAELFMQALHVLLGAPAELAINVALPKRAYQRMLAWLRVAEALARRLLLIEAAAFANVPPASCRHAAWKAAVRKPIPVHADKPGRVSFRCFAGDTHAPKPSRQGARDMSRACVSPMKRSKKLLFDARPIALRYEALIRVVNNPIPFARRLARRLRARAHRVREILHVPKDVAHNRIGGDAISALTRAAETAAAVFNSS